MILETNADIMTSIRRFYERLLNDCDFELRTTCRERIQYFALQVENMIDDSRAQIARAKVLVQITEARKTLVSPNTPHMLGSNTNVAIAPPTFAKPNNRKNGDLDH
jgi:hypothetical protein